MPLHAPFRLAQIYNSGLVRYLYGTGNKGTPLCSGCSLTVFVFELYDEPLKPLDVAPVEPYWGLCVYSEGRLQPKYSFSALNNSEVNVMGGDGWFIAPPAAPTSGTATHGGLRRAVNILTWKALMVSVHIIAALCL